MPTCSKISVPDKSNRSKMQRPSPEYTSRSSSPCLQKASIPQNCLRHRCQLYLQRHWRVIMHPARLPNHGCGIALQNSYNHTTFLLERRELHRLVFQTQSSLMTSSKHPSFAVEIAHTDGIAVGKHKLIMVRLAMPHHQHWARSLLCATYLLQVSNRADVQSWSQATVACSLQSRRLGP